MYLDMIWAHFWVVILSFGHIILQLTESLNSQYGNLKDKMEQLIKQLINVCSADEKKICPFPGD